MTRREIAYAAIGAALALKGKRLLCWWKGQHNPARTVMSFFVCRDCGFKAADLGPMKVMDSGFVRGRR